jgi:hypothetical protein
MNRKEWLIIGISTLYLISLFLCAFPPGAEIRAKVNPPFVTLLHWTGLWQDWSMFSPNPSRTNAHVEVRVRFRDGSDQTFTFPRLHLLPLPERIALERFRKWGVDWLRMDREPWLWPTAARAVAKRLPDTPGNPPVRVSLIRYWHEVEAPGIHFRERGYRLPDSDLSRFEYYSLDLVTGEEKKP